MKNKGQTAMEYLMTYGWAILIIIVVVAALYAMGVFSIKSGVSCSPCFSYFAFLDYAQGTAGTNNGQLKIRNGAKAIVTVSAASTPAGATINAASTCPLATPCAASTDLEVDTIPNTAGSTTVVTITYTDQTSLLVHTDSATLHNK